MRCTVVQAEFRARGVTQKAFAEEHEISVGTVAGWSSKQNKNGISAKHIALLRKLKFPEDVIKRPWEVYYG